ncbi:hypothetical protein TSUD_191640 [Trifolium subterraneum]|uniref:Uncharacterized protein n=1 Tax=Trifolium subterraneum TaxID=3900 RepID=A0A2Z6LKQ2_TRISU|nr:hypothetical protein TSUD_191640 [Trifolium subterraneum]
MLPPKFNGSEVLLAVKFFVADSLSVIQWDPGGKDFVLSDYFIRRISGECYYGAQVDFLKIWSVLKWCIVHVVIADFSVSVVATSSVFMFDCASGSVALCHAKATMRIVDVLNAQNSNLEVVHKETTSLLAKEPIGGNTYEMVLLTLYGSNTLHLWNFAWLVHLGNVDFSNFTSKDFGRHSVNQFVIAYKERAVKEITWKTKTNDKSQYLKLRLEDKYVSQEGGIDRTRMNLPQYMRNYMINWTAVWRVHNNFHDIRSGEEGRELTFGLFVNSVRMSKQH